MCLIFNPLSICHCLLYLSLAYIWICYSFIYIITDNFNVSKRIDDVVGQFRTMDKSLYCDAYSRDQNGVCENATESPDVINQINQSNDECHSPVRSLYVALFSMLMLLVWNISPEYCFRKNRVVNECRYLLMENECGCITVYDSIKEP